MNEIRFDKLIDQKVTIYSSVFGTEKQFELVKIVGAEQNGIWVESEYLNEQALINANEEKAHIGAVYFLPFARISFACWIRDSSDGPVARSF